MPAKYEYSVFVKEECGQPFKPDWLVFARNVSLNEARRLKKIALNGKWTHATICRKPIGTKELPAPTWAIYQ